VVMVKAGWCVVVAVRSAEAKIVWRCVAKIDEWSYLALLVQALGRVLNDGDVMAIFCLKKINNISGNFII
jgi:hypothetical protein